MLFAGGLITSLGSMMTYVALPFQVAQITGSYVAVGLIGLAELVPLVLFGLYGGSLADRLDKRRVVLAGEAAAFLLAVTLAVNSLLAEPLLPVIYVVAMLFAAVDGLQRPSLDAILPRAVDLAAMTFAFPFALFPFIAEEYGAPWALGLLYSAGFVGGAAFGLTSGWTARIRRQGRAIAFAAAVWGVAVGLAGVSPSIWWVLGMLVIAGYFDMMSGHFRQLMWNQSIPDDVRGRMAGMELLSYSIGPLLGQVRSTTAAQLTGLRTSLITGGVACVVAVGVACVAFPAMWRYDARRDAHVERARGEDGSDGPYSGDAPTPP